MYLCVEKVRLRKSLPPEASRSSIINRFEPCTPSSPPGWRGLVASSSGSFPVGFAIPPTSIGSTTIKRNAPQRWNELLGFTEYRELLQKRKFTEIATWALKIEARTNLLFAFEKMAIAMP